MQALRKKEIVTKIASNNVSVYKIMPIIQQEIFKNELKFDVNTEPKTDLVTGMNFSRAVVKDSKIYQYDDF